MFCQCSKAALYIRHLLLPQIYPVVPSDEGTQGVPFLRPVPSCLLCPAWPRDVARLKRSSKPCWAPRCSTSTRKPPVQSSRLQGPSHTGTWAKQRDSTDTARCPGWAAGSQQGSCIIHHYTDSWCLQAETERAHPGPGKVTKISSTRSSGSGAKFSISCYNPVSSD